MRGETECRKPGQGDTLVQGVISDYKWSERRRCVLSAAVRNTATPCKAPIFLADSDAVEHVSQRGIG